VDSAQVSAECKPTLPTRALADGEGRFRLDGLPAGRCRVTARIRGLRPATVEVEAGATDVLLRLLAGARLTGRVRDQAGQPIAGFSVVIVPLVGQLERGEVDASSFFDASAAYAIDGLLPGRYAVTAAADGYAPAAEQVVTLSGTDEAHADFVLTRGGRIVGRVIDGETGEPIRGARISLEGATDAAFGLSFRTGTDSAADGRFALEGVADGLRSILVAAEGHHGRILSGLRADGAPLVIDLTPTDLGEAPRLELCGIGAVLRAQGDALLIDRVVASGGAAEVGLKSGDQIVSIEGQGVAPLGFQGAVQLIRGPESSTVLLSVRRGQGEPFDVSVPRRRVRS
jgi:hypothetical protein